MSTDRRRARGQPLVVLVALLLGWGGARVTSFSGESGPNLPEAVLTVGTATAAQTEVQRPDLRVGPQSFALAGFSYPQPPQVQFVPVWYPSVGGGRPILVQVPYARSAYAPADAVRPRLAQGAAQEGAAGQSGSFFGGYPQERPIASLGRDDGAMPRGFPSFHAAGAPGPKYAEPSGLLGGKLGRLIGDHARWSMDAWALLRKDGAGVSSAGILPATYGASQAGGVVRYRLAMHDPRRPSAYLRTTSTLGGRLPETSAALGLSARPLAAVPLIAAIEGRVTEQGGSRRVQPAAMVVTEIAPLALPSGLRSEIYAQGGYVAGRYATPFADGQVRVDHNLLSLGRGEARLGAGAWGGIQKGAARLDAGPGATVSLPLTAKVFGRLALDWRFRVAGDAEPGSGPAVTVAAGF